jgi:hypothetical protein
VKRLLYLIGAPGSGKTSVLRGALAPAASVEVVNLPPRMTFYDGGALVQIGEDRGGAFAGTDLLSMSAQPRTLVALRDHGFERVVAEGDRLANNKFFTTVREFGYELDVVYVDTPEQVAAQRRAARGSKQDPTWLRGRRTKVERLAATWATTRLDGTAPLGALSAQLASHSVFPWASSTKEAPAA